MISFFFSNQSTATINKFIQVVLYVKVIAIIYFYWYLYYYKISSVLDEELEKNEPFREKFSKNIETRQRVYTTGVLLGFLYTLATLAYSISKKEKLR